MTAVDLWSEVTRTMRERAEATNDGFLFHTAETIDCDVRDHKQGEDGCNACRGDIEMCSRWENAQELMLTWLLQQVARG